MNAIDYIQQQFGGLRQLTNATLAGLTEEQLNWTPPGTANSIKVTLLHIVAGEDRFIQAVIQGKPLLWETQAWSTRIGVENPPGGGKGWEETRITPLKLAPIMAYQEAVCAATQPYLNSLQPEELDRKVNLFGGERPVAAVLAIIVSHATAHIGEIAALKGVQGAKGLPY
jgi:uncharacterized damage-inducible protein DinB